MLKFIKKLYLFFSKLGTKLALATSCTQLTKIRKDNIEGLTMKQNTFRKTIDLKSPTNLRESNLHATRSESVYCDTRPGAHIFLTIQSKRVHNSSSVEHSFQVDPSLV